MALPLDYFTTSYLWGLSLLTTIVVCVAATFFLAFLQFVRRDRFIQDIEGPVDSASLLYGNLPELLLSQPYGKIERKWQEQYGSTYRVKGSFYEDLVVTADPTALRHVLSDAKRFDFTSNRSFAAIMLYGEHSIPSLWNGGEAHRRIKNTFSSIFTIARLQPYIPVIQRIARKAADSLMQQYSRKCEQNPAINIYKLLQLVTSDIIGEVGFGYQFNAVETDGNDEIVQLLHNIVILASRRSKGAILGESLIPYLPRMMLRTMLRLPTQTFKTVSNFRKVTETWAMSLLRDRLKDENSKDEADTASGLVGFLASVNENQKRDRLSLEEISQQVSALLAAGEDTAAMTLAWGLNELAKRPEWQDQIRKEILEARDVDSNLDKLPYLNAHIKETLRCYPSLPLTERVAFEDTVLPLFTPITTSSGRVVTELAIPKGQVIYLGLDAFNHDPQVWGPDAKVFDPLRWLDGRCDPENLPGSMGPYSSLASFAGGARVCLGWRLAVLEMQVVLFEFISRFHFSIDSEQEENLSSIFALTLSPLDLRTGKHALSLCIQPITDT